MKRSRSKRMIARLLPAVVLMMAVAPAHQALAADPPHVLVWGGAYGFRHPSITDAERTFVELAQSNGTFTVEVTENPADLNAIKLAGVDVLAWVSTTGKPPLTDLQREAIIRWAYCGGGTMAFHAAADSNYGWAEHAELLGAQFDSHPKNAGSGEAKMLVEDDRHAITEGWKGLDHFMFDDEYYRWRAAKRVPGISLPRKLPGTHVLLSLDESTVGETIQNGATAYEHHQPVAWTKTFRGGGRVYYNNMGHSQSTWYEDPFRTSIVNGIGWVSEKRLDADCFNGDEPLPAPQGPPMPDAKMTGRSCDVPRLKPRSAFNWETSGEAKRLTEDGDTVQLAPGVAGGLGWGAQTYVLDVSKSPSRANNATVTARLTWPVPTDDYDLSVTTGWGWYGSHALQGTTSEELVLEHIPHCAILQIYGDNMYGVSGRGPTLTVTVEPRYAHILQIFKPRVEGRQIRRPLAETGARTPIALGIGLLIAALLVRRWVSKPDAI